MSRRRHLLSIALFSALFAGLRWLAFIWTCFSTFAPGGDVEFPEHLQHRERLGNAIMHCFDAPIGWLGAELPIAPQGWYFLLPLAILYGALTHGALLILFHFVGRRLRKT